MGEFDDTDGKIRNSDIESFIRSRVERDQTIPCRFWITTPEISNIHESETISKVCDMLDRNGVEHVFVDTVVGSWNLNRDWIETGVMECAVEYCGVYPASWNIDDVREFEEMEYSGKIIVQAYYDRNGELVPNC